MSDAMNDRIGPRAGFGTRLVAALIDGLVTSIVGGVLGGLFLGGSASTASLLLGLAYYVYLEGSPSGQTVGKRVMGIRVIDFDTGGPLGHGRAAIRYFARFLSTIPFGLGYFWMLWDKQSQTWHDKLATAVVVPVSSYPVSAWPG